MILKTWTRPDSYIGKDWSGYVVSFGQTRDSACLTLANYETARAALCEFEGVEFPTENHWAVGWVQWIAVPLTNAKALKVAQELADRHEDYAVLDEDLFSTFESEAAEESWACGSIKDRIYWIKASGSSSSIFSARFDWTPDGDVAEFLARQS